MTRKHWALLAAIGLALTGAACDDTMRGVEKDTKENTAAAKDTAKELGLDEAAKKAAEKTAEAAEAARRGVEKIARDVQTDDDTRTVKKAEPYKEGEVSERAGKAAARLEEAGREIASEAKAAGIHADVKAALMRDKAVDASHIDVDVDDDQRILSLSGTVPNGAQKARAEEIARQRAGGYTIRSELKVAAR